MLQKFWLKSHDSLVVDTYSDTACFNEALELSKRLPERYEIVQTGEYPTHPYQQRNSCNQYLF